MESLSREIRDFCGKTSHVVRNSFSHKHGEKTGGVNSSEDTQTNLDVLLHDEFVNCMRKTGSVHTVISEEAEEPIYIDIDAVSEGIEKEKYLVCVDPLDGSSNIDLGLTVGTIFGIYTKDISEKDGKGISGRDMIAAGYCAYGASVFFVFAHENRLEGWTYCWNANKLAYEWQKTDGDLKMPRLIPTIEWMSLNSRDRRNQKDRKEMHEKYKYPKEFTYAVNYSNYFNMGGRDKDIVNFCEKRMTQRWVGSMIADLQRVLIRGGLFMYPEDKKNVCGKLRYLYEVAPFAFIIGIAGGVAIDHNGKDLLDISVRDIHQKVGCRMGSVEILENFIHK